ncbi:YIP1 family protein [Candidatus Peregrinibacteria bacterium]|nr:YIP1 family protein [Candidatus Peregrinibacteria bacterium]
MSFFDKLTSVLFRPGSFWLRIQTERGIAPALLYFVGLLVFFLILYVGFGLLALSTASPEMMQDFTANAARMGFSTRNAVIAAGLLLACLFLLGTFVNSAVMHWMLRLFGGQGGFSDTYKAYVYGATPQLLFMAVPYIGLVSPIYMLYLQLTGMSVLHRVSVWRVLAAAICSMLLLFVLLFAPLLLLRMLGSAA